jgi:ribosomal protein L13E
MSVQAVVERKRGKTRRGRGFSRSELQEVKLDFAKALKLRLPIDKRRKTKLDENVKALKQFAQKK